MKFILLWLKLSALLVLSMQTDSLHAAAKDGVLDLQSVNWEEPVSLEGEWRYYPNIFMRDDDIGSHGLQGITAKIPGGIRQLLDENSLPFGAGAWGTLTLELRGLNPPFANLGLHLRGDTAYQVFVKDLERQGPMLSIIKVGHPASRQEDSTPQVASPLGLWNPNGSGHYLLIVHLSGFYYTDTNLWTTPRIGSYHDLRRELDLVLLLDTFVAGAVFIMSVYYFSLFYHRREDKAALLLAVLSTAVFFRHLSCSPAIQQVIFPKAFYAVFSFVRTCEFGLLGVMGGAGTWFAVESFHVKKLTAIAKFQMGIGIGIFLFCLVFSSDIYPRYIWFFNIVLFLQVLTYLTATLWAMKQKAKGSLYLTLGGLITGIAVVYDMIIGLGYHASPFFVTPIGMTFLIFANGQVVAKLFAKAFRTAERLTVALQEEVERKTLRLRSMLDHIPQGVVSFVAPGIAEAEHSSQLGRILDTDEIAHRSLDTLLLEHSTLSADEKDRIKATLQASLQEDSVNFEINADQLPTEIEFYKSGVQKFFQVNWSPIINSQGIVESVQVTLNDLTQLRRVEQESYEQKQELDYIQEIIGVSPDNFRVFLDSSSHLMLENVRLIECNRQGIEDVVKILFINMHTIKGSARTLGLKKIANMVHEVEQSYVQALKSLSDGWNQGALLSQLEALKAMLEHYKNVFYTTLGHQQMAGNEVGLSRDFLEQHCQLLSKLSSSIDQPALRAKILSCLRILEEEVFQDATDFFQGFLGSAERIARDLGKDPPLVLVNAEGFIISQEAEIALGKAIIHVLRNALDHGIESPQERLEKAKAPFGCIKFQLEEADDRLCVRVEDDGRGLAMKDLKAKSIKFGLDAETSPQQIAELIFQPGLSTAKSITEISGRGMGMEALRKFIRDIGGDVQIKLETTGTNRDFLPFQILIFLPRKFYRHKTMSSDQSAA